MKILDRVKLQSLVWWTKLSEPIEIDISSEPEYEGIIVFVKIINLCFKNTKSAESLNFL